MSAKQKKPLSRDMHIDDLIQMIRCPSGKRGSDMYVGEIQRIVVRKDTDDGWWLADGSGIADFVFDSDPNWHQVHLMGRKALR